MSADPFDVDLAMDEIDSLRAEVASLKELGVRLFGSVREVRAERDAAEADADRMAASIEDYRFHERNKAIAAHADAVARRGPREGTTTRG